MCFEAVFSRLGLGLNGHCGLEHYSSALDGYTVRCPRPTFGIVVYFVRVADIPHNLKCAALIQRLGSAGTEDLCPRDDFGCLGWLGRLFP